MTFVWTVDGQGHIYAGDFLVGYGGNDIPNMCLQVEGVLVDREGTGTQIRSGPALACQSVLGSELERANARFQSCGELREQLPSHPIYQEISDS